MIKDNENDYKFFFRSAYKFLLTFENVTNDIIEKQLAPEEKKVKPKSINEIYKAILASAQNVGMSPNVIGGSISGEKGKIDPLGKLLSDFNPHKTYAKYKNYSPEELYHIIEPTLLKKPKKHTLWIRYSKTILSAAKFLSKFKSHTEVHQLFDEYDSNPLMRPFLPMVLSFDIDGIGFALSCDFLKEMGYVNNGKPDTNIKDIFINAGLLQNTSKNSIKADFYSLQIIGRLAKANNRTPYAVDKLLWLIGSGNFYLAEPKINIGRQKNVFIHYLKDLK